jgi:hypothetical protein
MSKQRDVEQRSPSPVGDDALERRSVITALAAAGIAGPAIFAVVALVQSLLAHLQDVNYPLWFTEGERKADSLTLQGLAAIAIFGVWSWKRAGLPLPDFDRIAMIGRDVNVVFDSDTEANVNMRQALMCLASYIKGRVGDT